MATVFSGIIWKLDFSVVIASMLFLSLAGCQANRVSKDSIDHLVEDNLRPGSTVADVIGFLDSRKSKHFDYEEGPEPLFAPSLTQSSPEFRRYVLAKIPNVRKTAVTSWDLYMIFFFDERGTMTEYKIKEVGTGP